MSLSIGQLQSLVALGRELSGRVADWQVHAFGKTMHSFMAPNANNPGAGVMYNAVRPVEPGLR